MIKKRAGILEGKGPKTCELGIANSSCVMDEVVEIRLGLPLPYPRNTRGQPHSSERERNGNIPSDMSKENFANRMHRIHALCCNGS